MGRDTIANIISGILQKYSQRKEVLEPHSLTLAAPCADSDAGFNGVLFAVQIACELLS